MTRRLEVGVQMTHVSFLSLATIPLILPGGLAFGSTGSPTSTTTATNTSTSATAPYTTPVAPPLRRPPKVRLPPRRPLQTLLAYSHLSMPSTPRPTSYTHF